MASVTIRGIPVSFPFEPYELQKDYMAKVIECLQSETNGVLESPTGTGKTLSLLCSSLAWLSLKKAEIQAQRKSVFTEEDGLVNFVNSLSKNVGKQSNRVNALLGIPMIIYASRTHSQLSQAMQELKRTSYSYMKASVLGSRDMMCIHPDVMKENTQSAKIHMCHLKVKTRSCHFYNRLERKKEDPMITEQKIVDIEDLIKIGQNHKCCPYYLAKELKQNSDIVFMPYNYLLDPRTRKALGIELANNIIILDEAHNIERICEDSASLQLKSTDITLCIEEITEVMKSMCGQNENFNDNNLQKDFTADELCTLKQILLDLEKALDQIPVRNEREGETLEGKYIFELFSKAGIVDSNYNSVIGLIDKIIQFLSTVSEGPFQRKGNALQLFQDVLTIAFTSTTAEFKEKINKCYKVHITIEEPKKKSVDTWLSKANMTRKGCRVLNYWCFSPGFGMNMLMAQGVRSIILTSGTLAPLKPLISELELSVGVFLENPHIVTHEQICVNVLSQGPDMEPLNCNYQNRENPKFVSSLGRSIANVTRLIPDGLLIFFPSYPIMQKCQQSWQNSGVWSEINALKQIYVEPREKEAFNAAMIDFYSKINDPNCKGAIFMGVCRGKVSEGLDFADRNGRAVIIIGLPYPPLKDPRIILKKRYLDNCNANNKEFLKGNDWYNLEASRAVNQAIGRVIRHQKDYGAILLMDLRFNNERIKSQMSLWLRNHIKIVKNFGEITRDLRNFYRNAEVKFPVDETKQKKSFTQTQTPVELEPVQMYKKPEGMFNFESSASSSGLVSIHKRGSTVNLTNNAKKKKINLVSNPTKPANDASADIKEYLSMVKDTLSSLEFQTFFNALKEYRDNKDFAEMVTKIDGIFFGKNQNCTFVLEGLSAYIKNSDKEEFAKYLEKIKS